MILPDSSYTHLAETEIAIRLILATVFGALVGFERELRDRPAGLRTHMLIALAAAMFTILAFEIFYALRAHDGVANMDPLRVIEAVTAGVAFLAAGTILQSRGRIKGLTTGAGMWLAGSLGLACGAGFYTIAAMGGVLTLVILVGLRYIERRYMPDGDIAPKDGARSGKVESGLPSDRATRQRLGAGHDGDGVSV
jgi:putative Mg2+ transporter-C (MgtC) family protein